MSHSASLPQPTATHGHDDLELAAQLAPSLDQRFAILAAVEWLAIVVAAVCVSPYAWEGTSHHWNPHLWVALGIGGLASALPVALALASRRLAVTPHINATCQMLMAGLMVHVTGGRIETHFAYFGLLAFLSFYRDWRVLVTATVVAGLDHLLRAALSPQSMYGIPAVSLWRPLEHATWVIFEVALLSDFIRRTDREAERFAAQAREQNQQLKNSERRYRAIFERAPLPMWLCDARTLRFIAVNDEAVRKYGYSPAEFLRMRALAIRPVEDIPTFAEYAATMQEGVTRVRQWRHKKKDGTVFEVETAAHLVEWAGKEAILVLVNDISGRKRVERERDQMEVQLRHAQKLESIGQLAAGIAHEINTPTQYVGDNLSFLSHSFAEIRSLLDAGERLAGQCESHDELRPLAAETRDAFQQADAPYLLEEIPKALEQASEGVTRIATLVKAMKEFSHPGQKEMMPHNLNRAIENTVTVARNEWKYVADLHLDLDANLPPIPCFVSDFNQVILNLIVNAAHAIAAVASRETKGLITIQTRLRENWVEVRVGDTGAGIPQEIRDRIFDPFFTTKAVGKGTGQGLAIARSVVVDKHGGKIHFESEVGTGTTFVIELPAGGAPVEQATEGVDAILTPEVSH